MPFSRAPRLVSSAAVIGLALAAWTCATTPNPNAAKYPPRGRRCIIHVYNTPAPGVKEWDDLGIARVECPLDVGRVQCMARLREEACKMGGDLLYDVPKRGLRPGEQAMVFMGHVAHTRAAADAGAAEEDAAEGDTTFDTTSPVEPLAPAPVPAPPADAGRD
ncbi:MAG TPA: hypothetical protein VMT03_22835 [Polyangia bacterium]|nr:hypothetical protein [Polyangia bacterium]